MDSEDLQPIEKIWKLLPVRKSSQKSDPVFSKDNVSSKTCLEVLSLSACVVNSTCQKKIIPIFYDVDRSDVTFDTKLQKSALNKQEERYDYFRLKPWKEASTPVDRIKGWHLKDQRWHPQFESHSFHENLHGALLAIGTHLHTQSKANWKSILKKLKKLPLQEVQWKSKISYNASGYEAKQNFLDSASFFVNKKKTNAISRAHFFLREVEIDVLINKSLIKIADRDNIWMLN